jgi:invasion protein IalB
MWLRTSFHKPKGGAPFRMARFILLTLASLPLMFTTLLGNASQQSKLLYGAWSYECTSQDTLKNELCVANQLVLHKKTNKAVLGVIVGFLPNHPEPHIIFRLSPSANVDKGAAVKVDELQSFKIPISNCDEKICEIRSFIPKELLTQMRKGKQLLFAFFLDQEQVTYPVSLDGFDKTYTELQNNLK